MSDLMEKISMTQDWHKADIKACIEKAGWSLRRLSRARGYKPDCLKAVLQHPWPKAERIIAEVIGVPPWEIWPSRYYNGKPNRPMGAPKRKFIPRGAKGQQELRIRKKAIKRE